MKNKNFLYLVIIVLPAIFCSSCRNVKDIAMFQDMESKKYMQSSLRKPPSHSIEPFDNLYLSILTLDNEVNKIFNPSLAGNGYMSGTQQMYGTPTSQYINGYRVSEKGTINLPIIGKIKLSGLTLEEAEEKLKTKAQEYLQEPTVKIKLLNYRINVLGEVNSPGFFYNYEGNINIIEAISLAKGITEFADLKNVIINRQSNNISNSYKVDLSDQSIYQSDIFYLQPDDLVYVPPTNLKRRNQNDRSYSLVLSTLSTLLVFLTLLK